MRLLRRRATRRRGRENRRNLAGTRRNGLHRHRRDRGQRPAGPDLHRPVRCDQHRRAFMTQWTWPAGNANYYYDIGFIALNDHNGKGCDNSTGTHQIGHYTGWLGNWYGEDYSQVQWNLFGYPTTSPFNGNYLYQDNAATALLNPFGFSGTVGVGSAQAGGITGGPWVLGFDPNNATDSYAVDNINAHTNLINSVVSYRNGSFPLLVVGPQFESNNFNNLYGGYIANNGCH